MKFIRFSKHIPSLKIQDIDHVALHRNWWRGYRLKINVSEHQKKNEVSVKGETVYMPKKFRNNVTKVHVLRVNSRKEFDDWRLHLLGLGIECVDNTQNFD